jgi:GMP synthase-like glutamine amidotransferase
MRVQVLQHVPFEDIGSMAAWLAERNADLHYTRFHESALLPDPADLDLLIVMGGPMSVNDENDYPWLKTEKTFVAEAIRHGVAVVGVCLGAQVIAAALGARVYPHREKEIGWFPVEGVDNDRNTLRFPERQMVFHWHGDTFDLPPGAAHLARSACCQHQAFQVGDNIIGLQFHLETTPDSAREIVAHCRDELIPSGYVQTEEQILAAPDENYRAVNALMGEVLDYVTRPGA